jgi:hypothetical protein
MMGGGQHRADVPVPAHAHPRVHFVAVGQTCVVDGGRLVAARSTWPLRRQCRGQRAPAWPGAPTEEIIAFVADTEELVPRPRSSFAEGDPVARCFTSSARCGDA